MFRPWERKNASQSSGASHSIWTLRQSSETGLVNTAVRAWLGFVLLYSFLHRFVGSFPRVTPSRCHFCPVVADSPSAQRASMTSPHWALCYAAGRSGHFLAPTSRMPHNRKIRCPGAAVPIGSWPIHATLVMHMLVTCYRRKFCSGARGLGSDSWQGGRSWTLSKTANRWSRSCKHASPE